MAHDGFTPPQPRTETRRRRNRRIVAAAAVVVLVLAAGIGWYARGWALAARVHCGSGWWVDPDQVDHEHVERCIGISDSSTFGNERLRDAVDLIGEQNALATGDPDRSAVTVAVLIPVPRPDQEFSPASQDQVAALAEGAAKAQEHLNAARSGPALRVVLANEGSGEQGWQAVTGQLVRMKDDRHPLVAVTGLGVSVVETLQGARALDRAELPMVGAVLTANGLDATGQVEGVDSTVSGGGRIEGLFRASPSNGAEAQKLDEYLDAAQPGGEYALVRDANRADFYTYGLANSLRDAFTGKVQQGPPVVFGGDSDPGSIRNQLNLVARQVCGRGGLLYGGRASLLPDFLDRVSELECGSGLTVVTGSDAAGLRPAEVPEGVKVVYAALADPDALRASPDPLGQNYREFEGSFLRDFPKADLANGWAIMEYDAMLAAGTAITNATGGKLTGAPPSSRSVLNSLRQLGPDNEVTGAGGLFWFDAETGEPRNHPVHVVEVSEGQRRPVSAN